MQSVGNYLVADDVSAGFDIRRNGSSPCVVGLVHHTNGAPDAVFVDGVFGNLEEFEVVDLDVGDVPVVGCHPCCDGAFVAVQPVRPVKSHVAPGAHLSDGARSRSGVMGAGHIWAAQVHDRTDVASTKGDPR